MNPYSSNIDAWNQYWAGDKTGHTYSDQDTAQPALLEFWQNNLKDPLNTENTVRVLDLACGNGALTHLVQRFKGSTKVDISCLDASGAALDNVTASVDGVKTIKSDMHPIPLDDGTFDLVLSQFGTEYAGLDAFDEALRMVAPNGKALLIMHMRGSAIEAESQANFDAISALLASNFIEVSNNVIELGFKRLGANTPENANNFKQACAPLNTSISLVDKIMGDFGVNVAAGTVHKLYNTVANIVENLAKYDPSEVKQWLANMQGEILSFQVRMASMLKAALNQDEFNALKSKLSTQGFSIGLDGAIIDTENDMPLAWALRLDRAS